MTSRTWLAALLVLATSVVPMQAQSAAPVLPGPPGPPVPAGAAVVAARCMGCHGTDLISSQRLSPTAWSRELDKMTRWGAVVAEAERATLLDHLATSYGPRPMVLHAPEAVAAGEAVYQRACLACHGTDLVQAQRLTTTGWTREVEKMVRWGAVVSDTDKPTLVAFLATRHAR